MKALTGRAPALIPLGLVQILAVLFLKSIHRPKLQPAAYHETTSVCNLM